MTQDIKGVDSVFKRTPKPRPFRERDRKGWFRLCGVVGDSFIIDEFIQFNKLI